MRILWPEKNSNNGFILTSKYAYLRSFVIFINACFIAFVGAMIMLPANAHAAESPKITGVIRSDSPLKSVLVLKNTSKQACLVAETSTGTVAITRVIQNGEEVVPTPMDVSFQDGLDAEMRTKLRTLQPGQSTQIELRATKSGEQIGLRPVTWSQDGGALGLLYLVKSHQPIQMELNYSVPIDSESDTPICSSVSASTIRDMGWTKRLGLGFAIFTVALVFAMILIVFGRRKKKPAAAMVIAITAATAFLNIQTQSAHAQVTVPTEVQSQWNTCVGTLRANSDITQSILDLIDNPSVHIVIDPTTSHGTEASSPWPDGTYHIYWNLHDGHRYAGTGGFEDPCTSIYHELYHVLDMENRTFSRDDCAGSGIETKEVMATRAQNLLRARLGMPERSHYGSRPLPTGDCRATPPPPPCRGTCGRSVGDPHLLTFDGHYYDFHGVGEFTLARAKDGRFDVQVRQQPWKNSREIAINTAVVVKTQNHRLEVAPDGNKIALLIDGKKQPVTTTQLSGGDSLTAVSSDRIDLTMKDGTAVSLFRVGSYGVDAWIEPAESLKGKMEGLLGDFDDNRANDLRLRGENAVIKSDFADLYPSYANSWRISNKTSHFTYLPGKTTESYTNRAFPYERPDPKNIAGYAAAEAMCKRHGITDSILLSNCAFDVAVTGRAEFIRSAARQQSIVASASEGAEVYTLAAKKPGEIGKVVFTAKKDEKIFVDIYSSTFNSVCGNFTITNAENGDIASGCIINGKGYVETTTIPTDGNYSLQLRATDTDAGEARVRLYRIKDQVASMTPDGEKVVASFTQPGMEARFTFNAKIGQRFFLNVPSTTLSSQCSPLEIISPGGKSIGNGCLINGKGFIDTVVAEEAGQHVVRINPVDITTGKATLLLNTSQLISKTVNMGSSTKLTFNKPGDEAEIKFNGTAGQRIYIDMLHSTLPSQCGGISLKMPNGDSDGGCIIGETGTINDKGIVLPVSGIYSFNFNPVEANTGEVTVRIRS